MVFEIEDKVAIVTGGVSGIGLNYTRELLENGAKGVTVVDVNRTLGEIVIKELEQEYGKNRVIFIHRDITDTKQFEDTFVETINKFENVDILMNNAGMANDSLWENEIAVNLNGTINGVLLGMEKYLLNYKQGDEALIINTASIAGLSPYPCFPIYSASKYGVVGLTKCWGTDVHYEATKVRVVAVCPGGTITPMFLNLSGRNLEYEDIIQKSRSTWSMQEPECVAKEAMQIIKYADNGTVWVVEAGEPAYEYIFPDRTTMKKNILHISP